MEIVLSHLAYRFKVLFTHRNSRSQERARTEIFLSSPRLNLRLYSSNALTHCAAEAALFSEGPVMAPSSSSVSRGALFHSAPTREACSQKRSNPAPTPRLSEPALIIMQSSKQGLVSEDCGDLALFKKFETELTQTDSNRYGRGARPKNANSETRFGFLGWNGSSYQQNPETH
jgi:hypothetical protein